jgi:hypothetical protein
MSQAFCDFSSFARNIQDPVLSFFSQNPQNEVLTKISFFANDFVSIVVSISQRANDEPSNAAKLQLLSEISQ